MTLGEEVTVPLTEYLKLVEDSQFLARLHAAGVDNWEGYEHAFDFEEEEE